MNPVSYVAFLRMNKAASAILQYIRSVENLKITEVKMISSCMEADEKGFATHNILKYILRCIKIFYNLIKYTISTVFM